MKATVCQWCGRATQSRRECDACRRAASRNGRDEEGRPKRQLGRRDAISGELLALGTVGEVLLGLDPPARGRVLAWAVARFGGA